MPDWRPGPDESGQRPTLLFVSRQHLLAESLGAQLASSGSWTVKVLDEDHPHLLEACRTADPALVILDIDDQLIPGMAMLSNIISALPRARVLVMGDIEPDLVAEAIDRGARGCLTYAASIDEVHDALEAVSAGQTVVPAADLTHLIEGLHHHPQPATPDEPRLSRRELDILRRLTAGQSTGAIALELGISVPTVRKHTQNILAKLGVHSKLQAAAYAVRRGLV